MDAAINDLLAGVIDLAPSRTPPHGPDPCGALCVPACTGRPVDATADLGPSEGQDLDPSAPATTAATL